MQLIGMLDSPRVRRAAVSRGFAEFGSTRDTIEQAGLTTAVVWHFIQQRTPEVTPASAHRP